MKKKIMVSTNIYSIDPLPYASHMSMIYRVGKNLPDYDLIFSGPWRLPIDTARNYSVEIALKNECDYLFFYDDDMILNPDVVEKLLKRKKSIVMALCYIRGYPFRPMMFRFNDSHNLVLYDYKEEDIIDGLVKVDAVGNACTLIDCELLKLMPEPWFVTGTRNTEDIYFCMKAMDYVKNVEIYVDMTIESGHMLDKPILTSFSRELLLEMQEKGVNQLWQPDLAFKKDVIYDNPLEKWEEKENGNKHGDKSSEAVNSV